MSLQIYKNSGGIGAVSQNDTFTNPLVFEASQSGGILEQRLYLRSDNPPSEAFEDGVIFAQDSSLPDEAGWVSFAEDNNGAPDLYFPTMNFTIPVNQELPFWIKVDIPTGQEIQIKTEIGIYTDYVTVEA